MKLTKRVIEAAKYTGSGVCRLWDGGLPGFGLRIYPSGKKAFIFKYRSSGRQRYLTLGPFGPLTVQQARQRAEKARVAVADGDDPRTLLTDGALTMAELAAEYMADIEAKRKPTTVTAYRQLIDQHLVPKLGKHRPAAITEEDCRKFQRSMRKTPYSANRGMFILTALLDLAKRKSLRDGLNPAKAIKRYPEKPRSRFLSADELGRLGTAIAKLETEGTTVTPHAAAAIRLLLFTGLRKSEVLGLRWADVDLQRAQAFLRDTKTGARAFPLPAPALAVLESLPRTLGHPYVIEGGKADSPLVNLRKPWVAVREAAELGDVRLHDLRHTVGSWGAGGGLSLLLVGKVLGHRHAASTERYAHVPTDPVRAASEQIASGISAALEGKKAEVVEINRR